jgi:hypothetical protein
MPAWAKATQALRRHCLKVSASFRQGITTETSGASLFLILNETLSDLSGSGKNRTIFCTESAEASREGDSGRTDRYSRFTSLVLGSGGVAFGLSVGGSDFPASSVAFMSLGW